MRVMSLLGEVLGRAPGNGGALFHSLCGVASPGSPVTPASLSDSRTPPRSHESRDRRLPAGEVTEKASFSLGGHPRSHGRVRVSCPCREYTGRTGGPSPGRGPSHVTVLARGPCTCNSQRGDLRLSEVKDSLQIPWPVSGLWGNASPGCRSRGPCLSPGRLGGTGMWRGGKLWVRPASVLSSTCVPCTARSLVSDFIVSCRCGCLTASSGSRGRGREWLSGFLGGEKDDTNDSVFHFPDPTQGTFKMWKFY